MNPFTEYIKLNKFQILKEYTDCHNKVYKVRDSRENIFILKTNSDPEWEKYLKNEIDWLQSYEQIKSELSIGMPKLLKSEEYKGGYFLYVEFIDGESYQERLDRNALNKKDIESMALFTHDIEGISYVKTVRSEEKKKLSFKEWDDIFLKYMNKWYEEISGRLNLFGDSGLPLIRTVDWLCKNAEGFSFKKVGRSGIHGSSKLDEYIVDTKGMLNIVDWEAASSIFINFYQTASIVSYIAIRLGKFDLARLFLSERYKLLARRQKEKFNSEFIRVQCQRMLGDIWDLVFHDNVDKDKLEERLDISKIKQIIEV